MYPKGVSALIVKDDLILCVRRGLSDKWGLPGGRLEPGELSIDAVVRELMEETGLKVSQGQANFVYAGIASADHLSKKDYWVETFYFEYPKGQIAETIEPDNIVAWKTKEELMRCSSFPVYHHFMFEAAKDLIEPQASTGMSI